MSRGFSFVKLLYPGLPRRLLASRNDGSTKNFPLKVSPLLSIPLIFEGKFFVEQFSALFCVRFHAFPRAPSLLILLPPQQ